MNRLRTLSFALSPFAIVVLAIVSLSLVACDNDPPPAGDAGASADAGPTLRASRPGLCRMVRAAWLSPGRRCSGALSPPTVFTRAQPRKLSHCSEMRRYKSESIGPGTGRTRKAVMSTRLLTKLSAL